MTHFILVPGMNHGAWWFTPLVDALARHGHTADPITPIGVEQEPDADRRIVLETHIDQVISAIDAAPAGEIVLVGHSYGGMLISAAADRRPGRMAALVYLDALLPQDGESAWDIVNDEERQWWIESSRRTGDFVDGLPFFDERARPHPLGTLFQAVTLTGAWHDVPTLVYVEATDWPMPTPMRRSIDRVAADGGFTHLVWDTRHNVMHDGPGRVERLLTAIADGADPATGES